MRAKAREESRYRLLAEKEMEKEKARAEMEKEMEKEKARAAAAREALAAEGAERRKKTVCGYG